MDDVDIAPHDPNWPCLFEAEAAQLRAALKGEPIAGLEHFGSTAIRGLAAKPIIDIMIAVPLTPGRTRELSFATCSP